MHPHPYDHAPRLPDGPLDVARLAAGAGPVELEIGVGRAEFLVELARRRPDTQFVGIEVRRKWVAVAVERAAAAGVANVRFYAGDGREALNRLGPEGAVRAVYVHFPDPWWKKRHAKRRILSPEVVRAFARILGEGGVVFAQTDVPERAEGFLEVLEADPAFENLAGPGKLADVNPAGVRSHRERRCDEEGLPVYRVSFRRLPR